MTMNPLPPQAYTKETLLRAYHWLQNQPGSIREMALTPDILVSLYLKASRDGDNALERPSIQNFKAELKNLAGMMGELESHQKPTPTVTVQQAQATTTVTPTQHPVLESQPHLDAQSAALVKEIKALFNLTSDSETLRLLIKIGYENARMAIPRRPERI